MPSDLKTLYILRLGWFLSDGPCRNRRVLVPVQVNRSILPAWLHVVVDRWAGTFKELTSGIYR